jgi:hypothetical protein
LIGVTYVACAAASVVCAALLVRGWLASRERLLLWCALCFVGLAVNNVVLVVDLVIVPTIELSLLRHLTAHAAMAVLLFGLVWERK